MANNGARTSAPTIDRRQKMQQALEYRKAGATFEQIAEKLGLSNKGNAYRLVRDALKEVTREPAEEVLILELERLDRMLMGMWGQAAAGDVFAVDRVLKIMDRRAKYLGLDTLSEPDPSKDARAALTDFLTSITTAVAGFTTTPEGKIVPEQPDTGP